MNRVDEIKKIIEYHEDHHSGISVIHSPDALAQALADSEAERVKELEKEILELRSYCMITFGESHPEIKKCIHEVQAEKRGKAILEVWKKIGGIKADDKDIIKTWDKMFQAIKTYAEGSGECSECGASVKENRRHWIKCPNRGSKG